jgi:single-stranded-DNA-specific exonuclease
MPLQPSHWQIAPPAPQSFLDNLSDFHPLVGQILYNRGITDPAQAREFIAGAWDYDNPFRLRGMSEAVTRLRAALRAGETIAIYGDYDADGVTAVALLVIALRALGAGVHPYIPNRFDEGYGLNDEALGQLAREGAQVVVSVDCGIRSIQEAETARRLGLDLIITDHHTVGETLPPAVAVINPRRPDCRYPFKQLAGVGLAYKLAQALLRAERKVPTSRHRELPQEEDFLDLVALGTVADIVPLLGENRALVRRGLELLNRPERPGVRALMAEAGVGPGQVTATTIGYVLAPRINAAGRLDTAQVALQLLVSEEAAQAEQLARQLGEQNRERQRLTGEAVEKALARLEAEGVERSLIFIADESFPSGVVGLVAGRLSEQFYRPAIVAALEEEQTRASARSIPEFHVTRALDQCAALLIRHGGHAAAAGFTARTADLDTLRSQLEAIAERELAGKELVPTLEVDAEVDLSTFTHGVHELLAQLEPCGEENPTPLFVSRRLRVRNARCVGQDGKHLKLALEQGGVFWDAIAFRQGERLAGLPTLIDLAYSVEINEWEGRRRLQLNVQDLRPAG